jgi:hypothetical protein
MKIIMQVPSGLLKINYLRMKNLIITITLLLLSISGIVAQENNTEPKRKNALNLQVGLERGYFKDANFSPLNYAVGGLAASIGYRRNLNHNHCLFFVSDVHMGQITTSVSDFNTSDHYKVNLELGYLKSIPLNTTLFKAQFGGQFHSFLDAVFYAGGESITYFALHSFDLVGNFSADISDKHSFESSVSLPVFGLLVRPPWTGWNKFIMENEDNPIPIFFKGKWTSLNNFFAFNLNIQYKYKISPAWDLAATYQFRYYHTNPLETAIIPTNQITIGTNYSF